MKILISPRCKRKTQGGERRKKDKTKLTKLQTSSLLVSLFMYLHKFLIALHIKNFIFIFFWTAWKMIFRMCNMTTKKLTFDHVTHKYLKKKNNFQK